MTTLIDRAMVLAEQSRARQMADWDDMLGRQPEVGSPALPPDPQSAISNPPPRAGTDREGAD